MKASTIIALCAAFATIQGVSIQRRASKEVATSEKFTTPATHNSYKRGEEDDEIATPATHNSYKRGEEDEDDKLETPATHNTSKTSEEGEEGATPATHNSY